MSEESAGGCIGIGDVKSAVVRAVQMGHIAISILYIYRRAHHSTVPEEYEADSSQSRVDVLQVTCWCS
jgi:hypothetical protein